MALTETELELIARVRAALPTTGEPVAAALEAADQAVTEAGQALAAAINERTARRQALERIDEMTTATITADDRTAIEAVLVAAQRKTEAPDEPQKVGP